MQEVRLPRIRDMMCRSTEFVCALMNKFLFLLLLVCSHKVFGQGFRNPVIPGFYPDPSVCRVRDDFYLVTSSFEYFPGVPLFQSKDLIHWKQIGHCLTRKSQLNLDNCISSGGIYAPTIRYHNGVFYMTTTNLTSGGNFYVTTADPTGEWSDPIWVNQGGIDPTIFFDEDRAYYITAGNGINLAEIDIQTGKLLTQPKEIWNGTGGRYPEGPHIYKKDGYYYLMISEGGTEYGHKITISRSRSIFGPYTSNLANPILTHINQNAQSNPIQGTGHGDLVQAPNGLWWMVFLAFRPQYGLHHLLGRETFLAPVSWEKNAWPVVNGNGTVSLQMDCITLPFFEAEPKLCRDEFVNKKLSFELTYLRNPDYKNYELSYQKGYLRLKGDVASLDENASPTFLGHRQQHINFQSQSELTNIKTDKDGKVGLTIYMNQTSHYDLYVTQEGRQYKLCLRCKLNNIDQLLKVVRLRTNHLVLKITGEPKKYHFMYSQDNVSFTELFALDTKYLSSETVETFTGVFIAMFAEKNNTSADFQYFEYKGMD